MTNDLGFTDNDWLCMFNQYRAEVLRVVALWNEDRAMALNLLGPQFRLTYEAPVPGEHYLTFRTFAESFCQHIIPSNYDYTIDLAATDESCIMLRRITGITENGCSKNDVVHFTTTTGMATGVIIDVPCDNDPDNDYATPLACYRVATPTGIRRVFEYQIVW